MSMIPFVKRLLMAASFVMPMLAAAPAQAQGDGPFSQCLEESGRQVEAFKACLIEHEAELQVLYDLPASWTARVHVYLQVHPNAWDRFEDLADRLENQHDRAENARDRREGWRDAREDRQDDEVGLEDLFDRREDVRDRTEERRDRRENARDRAENRFDRRH